MRRAFDFRAITLHIIGHGDVRDRGSQLALCLFVMARFVKRDGIAIVIALFAGANRARHLECARRLGEIVRMTQALGKAERRRMIERRTIQQSVVNRGGAGDVAAVERALRIGKSRLDAGGWRCGGRRCRIRAS